jgi:hypothetical protein
VEGEEEEDHMWIVKKHVEGNEQEDLWMVKKHLKGEEEKDEDKNWK